MTVTVALGGLNSSPLSLPISRRAATASMSYGSDGCAAGCARRSSSTAARSYRSGDAAKCAAEAAGDLSETVGSGSRTVTTHAVQHMCAVSTRTREQGVQQQHMICSVDTLLSSSSKGHMAFSDSVRYAVSTAGICIRGAVSAGAVEQSGEICTCRSQIVCTVVYGEGQ